jgi:DnaK suppressor protein
MDLINDPERFRPRLEQLRRELLDLANTADDAAATVELDQTRVGRLSRMDALQSQAMSVETRRRRAVQLKQIVAALRRLDDGDYGYCLECGEAIANKRLEIDPTATRCIVCAEMAER